MDGKQTIVQIAGSGSLIGHHNLFTHEPHTESAQALEDCRVCFLPKEQFYRIVQREPLVMNKLLELLSGSVEEMEKKLQSFAHGRVRERVADLILKLKELNQPKGQMSFRLTLTREDMADMTGATPETIIRTLSNLRNEKTIELEGREISILNEKNLNEAATGLE